jgi:hypothetical protein
VPTPRDGIPPDRLAAFAAEGAAMPLTALVAYALDTPDGIPSAAHPDEEEHP